MRQRDKTVGHLEPRSVSINGKHRLDLIEVEKADKKVTQEEVRFQQHSQPEESESELSEDEMVRRDAIERNLLIEQLNKRQNT